MFSTSPAVGLGTIEYTVPGGLAMRVGEVRGGYEAPLYLNMGMGCASHSSWSTGRKEIGPGTWGCDTAHLGNGARGRPLCRTSMLTALDYRIRLTARAVYCIQYTVYSKRAAHSAHATVISRG